MMSINTTEEYQSSINLCLESLKSIKHLATKYLPENEILVNDIANITNSYCLTNFEIEKIQRVTRKVQNDLNNEENNFSESTGDLLQRIDLLYKKHYGEEVTETEIKDSFVWKEIFSDSDVQEIIKKNKKISNEHFEKIDDSLLCSNDFKLPVDPITKTVIRMPYINKFCGHIFNKESILQYIQERKTKAKCPYMGCTNSVFRESDLKFNEKLKAKIDEYLMHHQSDESEDD